LRLIALIPLVIDYGFAGSWLFLGLGSLGWLLNGLQNGAWANLGWNVLGYYLLCVNG
jgi:hypothetical protein